MSDYMECFKVATTTIVPVDEETSRKSKKGKDNEEALITLAKSIIGIEEERKGKVDEITKPPTKRKCTKKKSIDELMPASKQCKKKTKEPFC